MSDFDEKKRNAAQSFGNIVRISSVSAKLDPQQLMVVMTQLLTPLEEGQALDLTPLEQFLKEEKRLTASEIEELFVFFQSREEKLGFPVKLPTSLGNVSEARRARILEQFQKAPQIVTYSGPGSAREPSGTTPAQKPATTFDKKGPGGGEAVNRKLLLALLIVIVTGGGYLAISSGDAAPPLVELDPLNDPKLLPCTTLVARGDYGFCDIGPAALAKLSREDLQKRGGATLKALSGQGVKELVVRNADDGQPVLWR